MKDLSKGPVSAHILAMAAPIMIGMLVQTLYFMVDLYFVGRLGSVALAGVSASANVMLIVMAMTQMLSVGAVSLIARAVGAKQQAQATHLFNQSMLMGLAGMGLTLSAGLLLAPWYLQTVGADAQTQEAGLAYLNWYIPGLALQFILNALGAGLRGVGIVKPAMLVQLLTVLVNIVLAPILIAGWGLSVFGVQGMGVAGAGLASSLAILAGVIVTIVYFARSEHYIVIRWKGLRVDWSAFKSMLKIGFPAGAEFACMFLIMAVIYKVVSQFGAPAMAGFGVGSRIMQAIFMPGMAIAFAVPAIAAQNIGALEIQRVRETMVKVLQIEAVIMFLLMLLCKFAPQFMVQAFISEAVASKIALDYLDIISWNFVASGLIFAASGLFQAFGNTWPSFLSTLSRVIAFAVPALWMSQQSNFAITDVWYLSVGTVSLQAVLSLILLRREWRLTRIRMQMKITSAC